MFKRFRIAILIYILLFVALGEYLASRRSTDWDNSLWVDVYTVNGTGSAATRAYIEALKPDAYEEVERFFEAQSNAHGVDLDGPFRIRLIDELDAPLPAVPENASFLSAVIWSLRMRWFVTGLHWSSDTPTPDITLFAIYHDAESAVALDRSTALRKGMIAVANLYASRRMAGSNRMIVAHEILHTLGATDKYDLATLQPLHPHGFAEPEREPLYPQPRAELMAGRIPVSRSESRVPNSLDEVVIGPASAFEIGWREQPGATD